MAVQVRVTAVLQRVVGGEKAVTGEGETVGQLIEDLDRRYPGFREQVLTEAGVQQRFVNIYLNDEDIRFLQQLDTPVRTGDVISILPALAGGGWDYRRPKGSLAEVTSNWGDLAGGGSGYRRPKGRAFRP